MPTAPGAGVPAACSASMIGHAATASCGETLASTLGHDPLPPVLVAAGDQLEEAAFAPLRPTALPRDGQKADRQVRLCPRPAGQEHDVLFALHEPQFVQGDEVQAGGGPSPAVGEAEAAREQARPDPLGPKPRSSRSCADRIPSCRRARGGRSSDGCGSGRHCTVWSGRRCSCRSTGRAVGATRTSPPWQAGVTVAGEPLRHMLPLPASVLGLRARSRRVGGESWTALAEGL